MNTLATNRHEQTRTDTNKGRRADFFIGLSGMMVRVCSCTFVVMISLLVSSVFAAEILTGKLMGVSGEVEVQKRGSAQWVRASNGMTVNPGDQINTGLTGRASLTFKNSVTEINPLTQFVVGRVFEDNKNVNTEIFLQVGKVVSVVDPRSAKANKFTVTTPTAVAGIRGTRQECSYSKGFGTEVKIRDGAGYVAPVRSDKLPPAVQSMLGIAPAGGGRAGGVGKGADKRGDQPKTVKEAVAEFNAWIQQAEQNISGGPGVAEVQPLLDASTLDYVMPVGDGLSASVQSATDPTAISDPLQSLLESTAPSVIPAGSTPAEDKAALQSTEIVDAPVTITILEAQAVSKEAVQVQSTTTATSTPTPPNRPTTGQSQGQ